MSLSNMPPKGTADWFPEEFLVRKYIFDTWREVCRSYGFEEYLGPLVESMDIWKAKSGEDVGGSELTEITDREGNLSGLALRPEMTPSVTRMVTRKYKEIDKPIKWFSIANFYRNEKPQKGRNREFWQLNADIFGESSVSSDREILMLALDIMQAFKAPVGSFTMNLSHRGVINDFFSEVLGLDGDRARDVMRLLDKYEKLPREVFHAELLKLGVEKRDEINSFMNAKSVEKLQSVFPVLSGSKSMQDLSKIVSSLSAAGKGDLVVFSGSLIRGFDYYDGVIFEVFDNNPENPRALFGGGRYNGLAGIFGVKEDIPAVGFAPGDETMKLFLQGHDLLGHLGSQRSDMIYAPILDQDLEQDLILICANLRAEGYKVDIGLSTKKLPKAIKYADKNSYESILIFGEHEKNSHSYTLKNLKTGEEKNIRF